ncbi:MAG: CocE/NonD family hydrolase, partial [Capsulimonadaceae bacterium]
MAPIPDKRILIFRRLLFLVLFLAILPFPTSYAAQAPAAVPLGSFAGEYTVSGEPGNAVSFYVRDGKLMFESDRFVPTELKRISPTAFGFGQDDDRITFSLGASGQPTSFTVSFDPGTIYLRSGPPVHHVFHDYVRTEVMIPMRDGVKLHAVILKPADIASPLPILLERTPYGVDGDSRESIFLRRPELARDGYIFVGEDIRGRYKSRGKFIMMRPLANHRDPRATDESTDAYDTAGWLVKNIPGNNGRVGVLGTSYDGFLATMAGIDPSPAVKAISPQAPMIDVWIGDDFFHNGAFRQSYGYDYVRDLESTKNWTPVDYGKDANGKPVDGFDYFLERGSFVRDVKESGTNLLPTWKLFLNHPAYDSVWSSRAVEDDLHAVAVPTLTVGGYYDQEDMYGPQEEYAKLEPHDTNHDNFLVLGPWRHGYWSSSAWSLGNLDYGEPIGTEFRARIEAKFFAHYLKNTPEFDLKNTASFQTGSNTWQYYSQFPPQESRPTSLYLAGLGLLSWNASTTTATTSYVSDPANPVPYRHRPIQPTYSDGSQWYNWLTEDQHFVTDRKDVAVFKLPVLAKNLTLTGEVVADIFASTTGSDNDLVVKLIDEYPGDGPDSKMRGYQLIVSAEIFRGRYLSGFDHPTALAPGSIHEYKFSLHDVDHAFKPGHTVMVEIQSTWFPLYDRNPQTFV